MAQITYQEINDQNIWEIFLKKHPEANFLQSFYWGLFHQKLGHRIFRYGYFQESELIGVCLLIVESAKRSTYLTIPGGPIINFQNLELVEIWKESVIQAAHLTKSVFIRVRPQLLDCAESQAIFHDLGFKPAPMHLHAQLTNQLDIFKSEDELLANMRKTTRYEIRKAQKLGIIIKTSTSLSDMNEFYQIQLEVAKRQNFVPFSLEYLKTQFEVFNNADQAQLISAYYEGRLLAQAFVILYGSEAVYHYGTSTDAGRNYPGAYLVQWHAILEAKKRGLKYYNFWGVAPAEDTDHRFHGLSVFKRGFGGQDIAYLPAQDLVIDKLKYAVNFAIESLRKVTRKL